MNLSNKQKDKLANLGLNYLINQFDIDSLIGKKVLVKTKKTHKIRKTKKRHKLSLAQRKEISRRMKKMWAAKRNG